MPSSGSRLTRNASALALFPILGMLGGVVLGALRVWIVRTDELVAIGYIVKAGFIGSVVGVLVPVVLATLERESLTSVKKLMVLVAVASVVLWVIITLLGGLVANGTL
jgi:hypothetical protein